MIDGRNVSDQPVKNDIKTYKNIRKIATGQADDYTTSCLKEYFKTIWYFKKHLMKMKWKMNEWNERMFFNIEEAKENKLDFS